MKISIIIPTLKENVDYLKMTVASVLKYSKENHEIIVVINNIKPENVPQEIKDIKGIKLIDIEQQGQGIAVNIGVKNATNEYVLISDDDVVFSPNWEELTEKVKEVGFLSGNFMENESKGGAAAPFVRNNCGITPLDFDWMKWEKDSLEMREEKMERGFGFPLICKKELWEKIGGYDISYDPYGSGIDSDLEYSVMLSGIMPMRWRGVITYHFAQVSGIFWKKEAEPYLAKNRSYFERKWGIARARSPQIWYCEFVIPQNSVIYRPSFANFSENNLCIKPDNSYNDSIECRNCRYIYLKFRDNNCPKCNK